MKYLHMTVTLNDGTTANYDYVFVMIFAGTMVVEETKYMYLPISNKEKIPIENVASIYGITYGGEEVTITF